MTHEKMRRDRIELLISWVENAKAMKRSEAAAKLSMVTGCSLARANEYIGTAVMAKVLNDDKGTLSMPGKSEENPSA